jgi:hypothetical protein
MLLMTVSPFSRPLLIYDDKCSSCRKFAFWARRLSRGWIRVAGHYYSTGAINAKKSIFPDDYDPTHMFWLINKNGAFGARSGLRQVFKEIITGALKPGIVDDISGDRQEYIFTDECVTSLKTNSCIHMTGSSCVSIRDTWTRIFDMLRNSEIYYHHHSL